MTEQKKIKSLMVVGGAAGLLNSQVYQEGLKNDTIMISRKPATKGKLYIGEQKMPDFPPRRPDFPPYQNLEVPKGCVKQQCVYSVDWSAGGQTYVVQFTYEVVFGTKRSFQKKTESMMKKVRALLQLADLNDIHYYPGFTVELKKNGQTEKGGIR